MIRPLSFLSAFLLCALTCLSAARAETDSRVLVSYSEPELEPVARRVQAELRSAGHREVLLERRAHDSPCASQLGKSGTPGQVGVSLRRVGEERVSAEICARPQPNQITVVSAAGHLDEGANFSIVVTEALHGLSLGPQARKAETEPVVDVGRDESAESRADTRSRAASSFAAEGAVLLDAPTGQAWVGVSPVLRLRLTRRLGFLADSFFSLDPVTYQDAVIKLSSQIFYARWGLFGEQVYGPVRLALSASAGPYFNRATATAVPPRLGGSDGTWGAILHLGASAEVPAQSRFFLRGSLGASTLLPRVRYQMAEYVTPQLGSLLLEGGVGVGVRWTAP